MNATAHESSEHHSEILASGCFGDVCEVADAQPVADMDMDRFTRLYTQSCVCKKPKGWTCALAEG
jgi:hypothetical protein